jgi:hypothetical protein
MNVTDNNESAALDLRRASSACIQEQCAVVTALAAAGIAGPTVFTAVVIGQGLLQPG